MKIDKWGVNMEKIVCLNVEEYKASIRGDLEEAIKGQVEYELYYDHFRDLPVWMLSEEFIKCYSAECRSLETLTEKGYALMLNMVIKMVEFCRGSMVELD